MSLEHAILVSLAEQSATGYELTRRFDRSLGFFWSATHQQIYRTLTRMQTAGLVAVTVQPGTGGPDRKLNEVTAEGRRELAEWSARPTPQERPRSEFAVKVRAMPFGDREAILADIATQREHHRRQLEHYQRNAARNYPDPTRLGEAELPVYLVLRGGIRTEQMYLDWCDEMLATLGAPPTAESHTDHDQPLDRENS